MGHYYSEMYGDEDVSNTQKKKFKKEDPVTYFSLNKREFIEEVMKKLGSFGRRLERIEEALKISKG